MSETQADKVINPQSLAEALRLTSGNTYVTSAQMQVMELAADMLECLTAERDGLKEAKREDARLYVRAITTISQMRESMLAIRNVAEEQYAKTPDGWLARIIEDTQPRAPDSE